MSDVFNLPVAIRKSTQALNYFARLSTAGMPNGGINKMKALKLLFFADRYHLRKYGRPVSDCSYFAMEHGPVASEAKQVAEDGNRLGAPAQNYTRRFIRKSGSYDFVSISDVDRTVLSQTDIEALDFAWRIFGHYNQFKLRDITHCYPEWKRPARNLEKGGQKRVEMDYADFFDEPDPGYNPCHELSTKERAIGRELFLDSQTAKSLWQ